jgi:hypothetical protein
MAKVNKKTDGLTKSQLDSLNKHKKHHTKKHMDLMKKLMKDGKSFKEAHNIAMKKVGK